jgi:hypothetical protein
MWRKLMPISQGNHAKARRLALVLSGFVAVCSSLPSLAQADDLPQDPQQCPIILSKPNADAGTETLQDRDCVEMGGAIGEMGLSWRSKLPGQVQWLTRKDAAQLCKQTQSDWGQKVGKPIGDGCVFLSEKVCTIITTAYTASALIGNAVRDCTP